MIKIEKDYSNIPESLQLPDVKYFPNGTIPVTSQTTHTRRIEVIEGEEYFDEGKYNNRYKLEDVRLPLIEIYNRKCAFCEQKVEQYHVEHYRPKKIYYWLAFSWDNLLMACPTCNQHKGENFELLGDKHIFEDSEENRSSIHSLGSIYDEGELPKMINPEVTDPSDVINFEKNGLVFSKDVRLKYTIEKCKVDRKYLNDERRKILDDFVSDVKAALLENDSQEDQLNEIRIISRKFIRDSKNVYNQYLAFRKFAIKSDWLGQLINETISA
tara:strand:- start:48717 stop:49526 length:810 start_codon:yes stop_codon:yes gene_type:complete